MDHSTAVFSAGLRKITVPQLLAEPAKAIQFTSTSPGRILAAFKRAAPALGLPRRVVDFVDFLMSHNRPQDWEGGPGPIVWPSDVELEDRLGVGRSQCKALVRATLDAGLVRLHRSPTGRRWGYRKGGGHEACIVEAYGFDLTPLGERMAEFECVSAEWEARRVEGKRLRREITSTRNHVLSLVDLAVVQELEGEDWPAVAAKADALWQGRGTHRDPLVLVPIAARLRALDIHLGEQVAAALAAVEYVETDPAGPEYRPRLTTTTQLPIANANTNAPAKSRDVGPDRPTANEQESSRDQPDRHAAEKPVRAESTRKTAAGTGKTVGAPLPQKRAMPSCALRGFVVTPGLILEIAPIFRDWTSSAQPGWDELARAAYDIRGALGISPHVWGQAWVTLGGDAAITVLAAICARHAAGQVTSPGGLLRRMVERHQAGTLRLDRTLFGLMDKLKKARP